MTRLTALLLALLFTASTAGAEWVLCAAPARTAAASHACCADMEMAVNAEDAAACCAVSQQTRERGPLESSLASAPAIAVPPLAVNAVSFVPVPSSLRAHSSAPLASSTPIYLHHRTLLI